MTHTAPRLALQVALAMGLFAAGAVAQARFPNLDRAQTDLASAIQHCDYAWRSVGPHFGGHLQAAMNHIRVAQAELAAAEQAVQ